MPRLRNEPSPSPQGARPRRHAETLALRSQPVSRADVEPTRWGWRHRLAATDSYCILREVIGAGANLGVWAMARERCTAIVLGGLLWTRNLGTGAIAQHRPGQAFFVDPGTRLELGTGRLEASLLLVGPAGLDESLRPEPGTGNMLARRPPADVGPQPARAPQRTSEERAARANAALGLQRLQPLPGSARTAADVSYGFNQHGANLAPVVPE